jgi:hypothetical protein
VLVGTQLQRREKVLVGTQLQRREKVLVGTQLQRREKVLVGTQLQPTFDWEYQQCGVKSRAKSQEPLRKPCESAQKRVETPRKRVHC